MTHFLIHIAKTTKEKENEPMKHFLRIFALGTQTALSLLLCASFCLAQQGINIQNVGGSATQTGNGTNTGALRVAIASDNTAFSVNAASTLSAETTKVIGTVRNVGNVGGVFDTTPGATAPANALFVGGVYNTSAPTPSTGQMEPFQLDSAANLKVSCITGCSSGGTSTLVPGTSGGVTPFHAVAAASTNATSLKASAGQLYGASIYNNATYPVYWKFYNKASSPTVGTDTVVFEVPVQSGTEREIHTEQGIVFGTGIAYALTKGITDADTTAVLLSDAEISGFYK